MVIFQTVHPAQLGATSDPQIKDLQQALVDLYFKSNKQDKFKPPPVTGNLDGDNGWWTFWPLLQIALDPDLKNIPAVGKIVQLYQKIWGYISGIPLVGGYLTSRDGFYNAIWNDPLGHIPVKSEATSFMKSYASEIATAVRAASFALGKAPEQPPPNEAPTTTTTPLVIKPRTGVYPRGAFAVRDPDLNVYRILVPTT